jgi:glyoxylate reductase
VPLVLHTNRLLDHPFAPLDDVADLIHSQEIDQLMTREEVFHHLPRLEAIINQGELKIDEDLLNHAPLLKIVANVAMGIDNFNLDAMTRHKVWATNTPDAFIDATADVALGLLLAVTRRLAESDRYVRSGQWARDGFRSSQWEAPLLSGKTLGIIGFGQIGKAIAHRAAAFGLKVIYNRRKPQPVDSPAVSLHELLARADFIVLSIPLTPETDKIINAETLALTKPGAILINVARGKVVDEAALADALTRGTLAGAGLDVFQDEPRVHPALLTLNNVVLTPHLGGAAAESRHQARQCCAENIRLVLTGHPPLTPINHL